MSVLYFAYGSNMATSRLQKRIPSVQVYGIGYLNGWRIVCNKRSKDGSGKANLIKSNHEHIWGVLFQIDDGDLAKLDKAEGGYQRITVTIEMQQNQQVVAETYISEDLTNQPIMYDWYKTLIVSGAEEHQLPAEYITQLKQLPTKEEHDENN